jgi:arylamine N-acetyltransferase
MGTIDKVYNDEKAFELFLKTFNIKVNHQQDKVSLLKDILRAFSKIPYENITKHDFYRKFISPYDVMKNFVLCGAGGTCFPLVYFLKRILDFFGFNSFISLADRTYAPSSHCVVFVQIKNEIFLTDVGFSVFVPVKIEYPKTLVSLNQGNLEFVLQGDRLDVLSIFGNCHKKFRYSTSLKPCSYDDFFSAWEKTYEFEMMNHLIIVKEKSGELVYIRDNFVHFIKNGISRNLKMSLDDVRKIVVSLGIEEKIFDKAVSNLGLKDKEI